ncbi:uncharacterized protein LOC115825540 [Chanos chanos]|uniref:Uncharacterized protein LOC115825540 n=1 Tax=Chanos chanos TaxID=29144 RepID=A0A6J2WL52_CHACN|nr:uncharacterized protein LOC115825540 [Chanos chanos]
MSLPLHYHATTTSLPLHYHATTMSLPLLYHATTTPLPCHYHSTTTPLPRHYHATTTPLPCHYHSTTTPLPYTTKVATVISKLSGQTSEGSTTAGQRRSLRGDQHLTCWLCGVLQLLLHDVHSLDAVFVGSHGLNLPEYFEVIAVDDVQVFRYDSNMRSAVTAPEWLNSNAAQQYWRDMNSRSYHNKYKQMLGMKTAVQQFNMTGALTDVNVYQAHGRCDLHSDGTVRGFLTHAFNGMDFLSLDTEKKEFIITVPQALRYKRLRERDHAHFENLVSFYTTKCAEEIKLFLQHNPRLRVKKGQGFSRRKQRSAFTEITCHVTGFYPRTVQVQWFGSDMQPVVEGVIEEYFEVLAVDDAPVFYYDSNMKGAIPVPEWINNETAPLWNNGIARARFNKELLAAGLKSATQQFNLTGASTNIYQAHGRCELHPGGTTQAFLTHAFNGKDFLSLDTVTKTFIAVVPQAILYKTLRERDQADVDFLVSSYKTRCFDIIKTFLQHDPRLNMRKVPEVSLFERQSSPFTEITCHVTGFYPRTVQVQWFESDMQPVVEGVIEGEVLPNGDGSYQIRKSVVIPAEHTDIHHYSCVVQHSSIPGNITRTWVVVFGFGFMFWWFCKRKV